jgi:DNA-binding MarR family transcriptional regulator
MAATELAETTMLTSGAMTNRIDRLETKGLVRRLHDPEDRRRVLVELTGQGLEQVENATRARFDIASAALARLDRKHRRQLSDLLRQLLLAQDESQQDESQ